MKLLSIIILSLCGAGALLGADKELPNVSFNFRCIGLGVEFRQMELYLDPGGEGKRQKVRLNDLAKTSQFEYSGVPLLRFYREPVGGSIFARVRYNPEQKEPLFIFTKAGDATIARVTSIEDSWSVYGANSYLLVNISGRALFWQVGEQRFKIEDTDFKVIEVPKKEAKTPVIALEVDEEGQASRVYRAKWHNFPNMRRLIFVRDTNENEVGSVRVSVVEDFLVPQVTE
jgi:hypothetical protein